MCGGAREHTERPGGRIGHDCHHNKKILGTNSFEKNAFRLRIQSCARRTNTRRDHKSPPKNLCFTKKVKTTEKRVGRAKTSRISIKRF